MLAATLQQYLAKMEDTYQVTAKSRRKPIYVGDLLTVVESEEEAVTFWAEANRIFRAVSMKLQKWGFNSVRLDEMFQQNTTTAIPSKRVENVLKALCLIRSSKQDNLKFSLDRVINFMQYQTNTKRGILQTTAWLYHPLRFLSPYVIRAKILFQEI